MNLKIYISAKNSNELLDSLKKVDISVPSQSKVQISELRERWSMFRLLSTLCKNNALTFPVTCNHDDRPDFCLIQGNYKVGIECTDAVHEDYKNAVAQSEKHSGGVVDPDLFIPGERMSKGEIKSIAKMTKLTGLGLDGNGDERGLQWSDAMYNVIEKKTVRLRAKGFKKYTRNELLIYDGLEMYQLDIIEALLHLKAKLSDYLLSENDVFDAVFIERYNQKMYKVDSIGSEELSIFNVWPSN